MKIDVSCNFGNDKFSYRVAGIVLDGARVLLVSEDHIDCWYIPGGRVSLFESSKDALIREIHEEMRVKPTIKKLLWTSEEMFFHEEFGKNMHLLAFYYLIDFPRDSMIYKQDSFEFQELDNGKILNLNFKWFKLNEIDDLNIKPKNLINKLKNVPENQEHILINELAKIKVYD